MNTQVSQARIAAPVVINNAEAQVNSTLATNLAQMQSFYEVTKSEATAYKLMKAALTFATDGQMLAYIKVKAINAFNPKNLMVGGL